MPRTRVEDGAAVENEDAVVVEQPLEIQVGGRSLAVVMRTPGHDAELARGFVVSEGVAAPAAIRAVRHESVVPDDDALGNVVRVELAPGTEVDWERLTRHLYASSSCGVCGKTTLDAALREAPPLEDDARFEASFFVGLPETLRAEQRAFDETGGLHAAALVDREGRARVVREDVGRHNAVDKVIGWAAETGRLPLAGHVLLVSGRVSYEIAQKALAARIPVVAAVSAPSSLAAELASRAGITLVAFLRGKSFSVYGRRDRIDGR